MTRNPVSALSDKYSVLMSVYAGEQPEYLKQSIESIFSQTVPADDFVIVCDGELTAGLEEVLSSFEGKVSLVRLQENKGLGNALTAGLAKCRNELVARMDSDDIAYPDRMEKQLNMFAEDPSLALVSGTVTEFKDDITNIVGKREVPLSDDEIRSFSHKRNPMNHPAVMFKKSAVEEAGGYSEEYPYFEDYYLWARMLMKGAKARNTSDPLVYMRVDDNTFVRRGGRKYASDMLRFHKYLRAQKWATMTDYITGALPHALICVLPNNLRKAVYKKLH
jgi:glycosyltransferase involved in cell wall biosynthesis